MFWLVMSLTQAAFAANIKYVAVTGQCSREAAPDRGSVVLTADFMESSAAQATSKVMKLYEKLRGDVKKLSLKDMKLQTSTYSVNPEHDYDNGKQRLRGYRAQMGLEIETSDINRLGEVIELGSKAGIQNASQLRTFLSVAKQRQEQEACLEEAVKNARQKAEKMAKAGASKVGEVLTIEEYKMSPEPPHPRPMGAMKMAMETASSPGIEARDQELAVTVYVTFALQ
ncbi:MAG: SIMPL domain-containing protein [Bdellovibrionales bacterium]|nr:SIMPL domain-containing protein [Bdellovibrionales bacterium]